MIKILLLSDTHSHIDDVILKYVNLADEVWHAGDIGNLEVTDKLKPLNPYEQVFGIFVVRKVGKDFPLIIGFMGEGFMFGFLIFAGFLINYMLNSAA